MRQIAREQEREAEDPDKAYAEEAQQEDEAGEGQKSRKGKGRGRGRGRGKSTGRGSERVDSSEVTTQLHNGEADQPRGVKRKQDAMMQEAACSATESHAPPSASAAKPVPKLNRSKRAMFQKVRKSKSSDAISSPPGTKKAAPSPTRQEEATSGVIATQQAAQLSPMPVAKIVELEALCNSNAEAKKKPKKPSKGNGKEDSKETHDQADQANKGNETRKNSNQEKGSKAKADQEDQAKKEDEIRKNKAKDLIVHPRLLR